MKNRPIELYIIPINVRIAYTVRSLDDLTVVYMIPK